MGEINHWLYTLQDIVHFRLHCKGNLNIGKWQITKHCGLLIPHKKWRKLFVFNAKMLKSVYTQVLIF